MTMQAPAATAIKVTPEQKAQFERDGYVIIKGLFTPDEAEALAQHFMDARAQGEKPGDFGGVSDTDPNQKYPRFINMHPWDKLTADLATRDDIVGIAADLIDDEPMLQQSMLYFKPPGGLGQGLHQDEQYINKDPLIAAWVALDRCDKANGQMIVVPGSHKLGMIEVVPADLTQSFTPGRTKMPDGAEEVGLDMEAGDTLYFHGRTIHGSYPNTTKDRFRRSFILHWFGKHCEVFEPEQGTSMSHLKDKPPSAPKGV